MADTPARTRRSSRPSNPEALAFGVVMQALDELRDAADVGAVQRTLNHAAEAYGLVVVDADDYRAVIGAANGQPRAAHAGALGEGVGEAGGLVG